MGYLRRLSRGAAHRHQTRPHQIRRLVDVSDTTLCRYSFVFEDKDVRARPQLRAGWVQTHMFSLAPFPPVVKWSVRLLWIVAIACLAVFLTAAAGGPGDLNSKGYRCLFVVVFALPALLCLARAWLIPLQRVPWTLFGVGMLCWASAQIVYFLLYHGHADAPYPSLSDALWLMYYSMSIVAALALMKTGFPRIHKGLWIDVALGGLASAAFAAALLVAPIVASTGGSVAAVMTNLAYPLMDVLIVALLIGVFVLSNGRPGPLWILIAIVWVAQVVFDTIYLYTAAAGDYSFGTMLDAGWPALMLLLAFASWIKPTVTTASAVQSWGRVVVTTGLGVVGLALLAYDHVHPIHDAAVVLAVLTVVAAFVRTSVTFAEMRTVTSGRELAMRNALILEAAGEGIIGTDADGRVTFINPAAATMTGYSAEELTGRALHATLHHTRPNGEPYRVEDCPMHAALRDGQVHHYDQDVYWRKDGSSFGVEATSTPIIDGACIRGAVTVFHDVSERRQLERAKDEFTSVVSHELRTPLTSIRGSLGLLESGVLGSLPERAQRMIEIAVQNTDRLVRLINDILDLERLHSLEEHTGDAACDAAQLIARAAETMLPAAVAADVTLAIDTSPAAFDGNPDRIIQTLTNLIGNAVKFSPAGGTVQISSERRHDDILFSVSDTGRGIPANKIETIFGRFAQVDSSDSRQRGGTGLGLAICRAIVERHGGRIWAQSTVGEGSTFSFVLPIAADTHEYLPHAGGSLGSVLICDDDDAILEVTGTVLEERGYCVILARTGEQAIERAIAERPDVVLLDLLLPGISGKQTVLALAGHPATCDIPIVVLSVLPRAAGELTGGVIADWIEKPAASANLFATLERAMSGRHDSFRVLVVERDPAVAQILGALFERHAIVSVASSDGPQTLELCDQDLPDLIVMDNDLPDVDGVAMQDWLRLHPRLSALPIAAYDARDVQQAEDERRAVGAVSQLLRKGQVTPEEFQWRVMTLLARPRTPPPDTEIQP